MSIGVCYCLPEPTYSVVIQDVLSFCVVAGNPVRVIKK